MFKGNIVQNGYEIIYIFSIMLFNIVVNSFFYTLGGWVSEQI